MEKHNLDREQRILKGEKTKENHTIIAQNAVVVEAENDTNQDEELPPESLKTNKFLSYLCKCFKCI